MRTGFLGVLGILALASPVIFADYCVMIPTSMVFLAALGPLNAYVAEKPTCAVCGAVVDASQPTVRA